MFDWLYKLLGTIMAWFNSITGSYAIALLLYAVLFKVLLLYFGIRQQKNSIKMAKMRPKLMKIEKKYAGRNDQKALRDKQQEVMELQQKEGYSIAGGCLPMILQLLIVIALYQVIQNPLSHMCGWTDDAIQQVANYTNGGNTTSQIHLIDTIRTYVAANPEKKQIFAGFGANVDLMPNFTLFGVNLAATPSFTNISILVIIPFLAAASQWVSMWLMKKWNAAAQPNATDPQTQMSSRIMDIIFPLMTLWFGFNLSGMLGLYWVYQSLLAVLQQYIISKVMPLPVYTPEELREMEKLQKEQQRAQRNAVQTQGKHKSLHYIDEDDYDTLPEVKNSAPEQPKKLNGLESAHLKDDNKK